MKSLFFILFSLLLAVYADHRFDVDLFEVEAIGVGEAFGDECSIDSDYLVVGAHDANDGSGTAYVFAYDNETDEWNLVGDGLIASDSEENDDRPDDFGGSVAVSHPYVVIGAQGADQAYIFEAGDDAFEEVMIIYPYAIDAREQGFGDEVHIDGDIVVVGAEDWGGVGSAFVFDRTVPFDFDPFDFPNWGQIAQLNADESSEGAAFGSAVYVDGDYIFVGADGTDDDTGAAYVFYKDQGEENGWGLVVQLAASNLEDEARFGNSIAAENGVLAVGAPTNGGFYFFNFKVPILRKTVVPITSEFGQ